MGGALSLVFSNTLMDSTNEVAVDLIDDSPFDILSRIPFELSYLILSYVGDYRNATLVCKRWKSLVDGAFGSGTLLRFTNEEMALMNFRLLGVDSLEVRWLNLDWKGLTSLPDSIGAFSNLNILNLGSNRLSRIPENVGRLSSLKTLYLHENQLTTIPESIGRLVNLEHLILSGNRLTLIPESVGALTNLEGLYLHGNRLTSIPGTIGSLSNLKSLWLSDNQLEGLPETIDGLSSLEKLWLSENHLSPESISKSICGLTSLVELDVQDQKSGVKWTRPPLPTRCRVYL